MQPVVRHVNMRTANFSHSVKTWSPALALATLLIVGVNACSSKTQAVPPPDSPVPHPAPVPLCSGVSLAEPTPSQSPSKRHSVTLSWDPSIPVSHSPADAIKGYYVYRSQMSGKYGESNRINPLPLIGTRCLDTAVEPRATYYYVVRTVTESGAQSVVSKEIKAVIPSP